MSGTPRQRKTRGKPKDTEAPENHFVSAKDEAFTDAELGDGMATILNNQALLPLDEAVNRIKQSKSGAPGLKRQKSSASSSSSSSSSSPTTPALTADQILSLDVRQALFAVCSCMPNLEKRSVPLSEAELHNVLGNHVDNPDIPTEEVEKFAKEMRTYSFEHISRLLVEAKSRPSPVVPGLIITPNPCMRGARCYGNTACLRGFDSAKHGCNGCTLMAAQHPEQYEVFIHTGTKPETPFLCILCIIALGNLAVTSIINQASPVPSRLAFQSFRVDVDVDGGYSSVDCLMPGGSALTYNGIVAPFPRLQHNKLVAFLDDDGVWHIDQRAMQYKYARTQGNSEYLRDIKAIQAKASKSTTGLTHIGSHPINQHGARRRGARQNRTTDPTLEEETEESAVVNELCGSDSDADDLDAEDTKAPRAAPSNGGKASGKRRRRGPITSETSVQEIQEIQQSESDFH